MPRDRRRRRQQPVELSEEQKREQNKALRDRADEAEKVAKVAEEFALADPKPENAATAKSARATADALEALALETLGPKPKSRSKRD